MDNLRITISGITGSSPYNIYLCQTSIDDCFYVKTITNTPYAFDIPKPFDNNISYYLKVIDNNNKIITSQSTINPTPTPTATITPTPSISGALS
jgi:hypothetical protein